MDCGVYLGVNLANLVSTLTLKALSIDDQYGFLFIIIIIILVYMLGQFFICI